MESLIANIAREYNLGRENLATEVLANILRADECRILQEFLERCGITSSPDAVYSVESQKGDPQTRGIFDIKIQRNDRPFVIIESKFEAPLTDRQRYDYLRCIDEGGLLLFIVPSVRKTRVSKDLSKSYCLSPPPYNPFEDGSDAARTRISGRLLGVTSWDDTMELLQQSVKPSVSELRDRSKLQDELLHDIWQLRRFCNVAEKEVFEPIPANLLLSNTLSTLTHQMTWIARRLISRCILDDIVEEKSIDSSKRTKIGAAAEDFNCFDSSSLFYGQNLRIGGVYIWMGFWPLAWEGREESLLWITFDLKDPQVRPVIRQLQREGIVIIKHSFSLTREEWLIPIPIEPDREQYDVVEKAFLFVSSIKESIERAQSGLAAKG